jgi:hypothetical protein
MLPRGLSGVHPAGEMPVVYPVRLRVGLGPVVGYRGLLVFNVGALLLFPLELFDGNPSAPQERQPTAKLVVVPRLDSLEESSIGPKAIELLMCITDALEHF